MLKFNNFKYSISVIKKKEKFVPMTLNIKCFLFLKKFTFY